MMQAPTRTVRFSPRPEEGQNPYIGIVSFQHFRGESLYSDVIVRPESNMCETEDLECYPIPDDVPQNGRQEGYYPDSSVAYFRILWKELEPAEGEYHFELVESILASARSHGQTVAFRLMPHSTRARDDVPEWLKAIMPCPERPDGMRVKDSPTDPRFLELFSRAVRVLGARFDKDPTLQSVDICLPGAWGEGHKLELYSDESIRALVDTFLTSFPNTQLVGQMGLPWVVNYANESRPVGWRGDGLGPDRFLDEIYPSHFAGLEPDIWKTAPVSFESYWWLGEWQRRGFDIDRIIQMTLDWHISVFNPKSLPIPWEWKPKIDAWLAAMGYHFSPVSFAAPENARPGDTLCCRLVMENRGVAPIYQQLPLVLRLTDGTHSFCCESGIDIRSWLPGTAEAELTFPLPENLPAGKYRLELGITDGQQTFLYLGTNAVRDGMYYILSEVDIPE